MVGINRLDELGSFIEKCIVDIRKLAAVVGIAVVIFVSEHPHQDIGFFLILLDHLLDRGKHSFLLAGIAIIGSRAPFGVGTDRVGAEKIAHEDADAVGFVEVLQKFLVVAVMIHAKGVYSHLL